MRLSPLRLFQVRMPLLGVLTRNGGIHFLGRDRRASKISVWKWRVIRWVILDNVLLAERIMRYHEKCTRLEEELW